jgi:hypothetical protein
LARTTIAFFLIKKAARRKVINTHLSVPFSVAAVWSLLIMEFDSALGAADISSAMVVPPRNEAGIKDGEGVVKKYSELPKSRVGALVLKSIFLRL